MVFLPKKYIISALLIALAAGVRGQDETEAPTTLATTPSPTAAGGDAGGNAGGDAGGDAGDAQEPCTLEEAPVKCGEDEFANSCTAEANGYAAKDCEAIKVTMGPVNMPEDCPKGTFPCSKIMQPVVCSGCVYENICFATDAGWDQGQCDDVTEPPKPTQAPGCPTWEDDKPKCDVDALPVICTSDDKNITTVEECGYYSPCFAAAAGYNVTAQCVNATGVGSNVKCPMGSFPCTTAIKDTVYCGEYCNYENTCFAASAGFDIEACTSGAAAYQTIMSLSLLVAAMAWQFM